MNKFTPSEKLLKMILDQFSKKWSSNVGGSRKSRTQSRKVKVLGRERVVTKQGRSNMIRYKGKMIPLKDARELEKKLMANK